MQKTIIQTPNAPAAIGTYSQAVKITAQNAENTVYLSGQIGLNPQTMQMVDGVEAQIHQVFRNLTAVAQAAGAELSALVKLNVFLVDLADFALLNQIMAEYCHAPYPARAAVQVAALPRGALVEMDGVLVF